MVSVTDSMQVTKVTSRMREQCVPGAPSDFRAPGNEARLSPERVWLRENKGKMERFSVESCVGGYHVYKARTLLVLAYLNERSVLVPFFRPSSALFTSSITTRGTA